jgi:hypothetical protein
VPGGYATPADAFREFLQHDGLARRIVKAQDAASPLGRRRQAVQRAIRQGPPDRPVLLVKKLRGLNG